MVSVGSSEKFVSRWPADNQEPPKTALIFSNPSTHSARRPDCARGFCSCARRYPSGGYGTICTGLAFVRAEEGPHDHHPLRRVGANRYLGRSCRPQRDERQDTRDAMMAYLPAKIPPLAQPWPVDLRGRTSEFLNADRYIGDNIDAKMRGHRPLQPVTPICLRATTLTSPASYQTRTRPWYRLPDRRFPNTRFDARGKPRISPSTSSIQLLVARQQV